MFTQTTRPLNPEELGRVSRGLSRSELMKSIALCAATGPLLALIIASAVWTQGPTPPRRGLTAEWAAWTPWLTAYVLGVGGVLLGVAALQSRRNGTRVKDLVVTETRVEGDLAAAVWGLSEGELDVVVIRTDPSHAWVGEAYNVGFFPDSTSVPAWVVMRELKGDLLFGGEESEARIPLVTVEAMQEETGAFEALLNRCVPIEALPRSVREALAS